MIIGTELYSASEMTYIVSGGALNSTNSTQPSYGQSYRVGPICVSNLNRFPIFRFASFYLPILGLD